MTAILFTERLRLRPFVEDDVDAWVAVMAEPEVSQFLGGPVDRVGAWRQLALFAGHWAFRGFGLWAIESKETGAVIGRAGLWQPEGWPGLELGWALDRSAWGHGYAAEAGAASRDWAFDRLDADRVIACIAPANHRSQAVASRIGLTLTAETFQINGIDVEIWAQAR